MSELTSNKEIQLAMMLKVQQLKREDLPTLTVRHLKQTLNQLVWKHKQPTNIHNAINDIMNLDVATIVSFLSINAIQEGSKMNMEDIKDMMEGENHE